MPLKLKAKNECQLDVLTFGECMIRLSPPGHQRIEFTPYFEAWVGGGEYNVSYALSRLAKNATRTGHPRELKWVKGWASPRRAWHSATQRSGGRSSRSKALM